MRRLLLCVLLGAVSAVVGADPENFLVYVDAGSSGSRIYIGCKAAQNNADQVDVMMASKYFWTVAKVGAETASFKPPDSRVVDAFAATKEKEAVTNLKKKLFEGFLNEFKNKKTNNCKENLAKPADWSTVLESSTIIVGATAGARVFQEETGVTKVDAGWKFFNEDLVGDSKRKHVAFTISGALEAYFGWVDSWSRSPATTPFANTLYIELGGASQQTAFMQKPAAGSLLEMGKRGPFWADDDYKFVYSQSFLGDGNNRINLRFLREAKKQGRKSGTHIQVPCMAKDLKLKYDAGKWVLDPATPNHDAFLEAIRLELKSENMDTKLTFIGTGDSTECMKDVQSIFSTGTDDRNKEWKPQLVQLQTALSAVKPLIKKVIFRAGAFNKFDNPCVTGGKGCKQAEVKKFCENNCGSASDKTKKFGEMKCGTQCFFQHLLLNIHPDIVKDSVKVYKGDAEVAEGAVKLFGKWKDAGDKPKSKVGTKLLGKALDDMKENQKYGKDESKKYKLSPRDVLKKIMKNVKVMGTAVRAMKSTKAKKGKGGAALN